MSVPAAILPAAPAALDPPRLHAGGRGQGIDDRLHEARMHGVLVRTQHRISCEVLSDSQLFSLCADAALRTAGAEGACLQLQDGGDAPTLRDMALAGTALTWPQALATLQSNTGWSDLAAGETAQWRCVEDAGSPGATARATVVMRVPIRRAERTVGAINVWANEAARTFEERDLAHLEILAEIVGAHLHGRHVAGQLRASRQQYRQLFESHPSPMYVFAQDAGLRLLAVNEAAVKQYGYSRESLLKMSLPELWPAVHRSSIAKEIQARMSAGKYHSKQREHQRCDGSLIDVEITSHAFVFNGQAACHSMAIDITKRLASERAMARMARARHLLSACNEAIVRASTETDLLEGVCKITVEIGGYRLAWVGLAQHDAERTIACAARAGENDGYLESLTLSWDADHPRGQGPAGETIRTGKTLVVPDVRSSPAYQSLTERLVKRGFYGMVCLPLREEKHTFGVLYLYAPEVLNLSTHEVELLEELAQDLTYGLASLRARQEQERMQAAVLKVAAAVSANTGNEFFVELTRNMAQALGAESACLGRFLGSPSDTPEKLVTLALMVNGTLQPNAEYALRGTPSERLVQVSQFSVDRNLRTHFPHSVVVGRASAEAYVGQQLCDSTGKAMGVLFVLFKEPLHNVAFVESTLQIFASRVSAELERQVADSQIRWQASVLDQARDAILVLDMAQRVTYWNKGAERVFGWTSEEALGERVNHLLKLDDSMFQIANSEVLARGEWAGEMVKRHRDGTLIETEGRWTLVRGASGEPDSVLAISTDIRERKSTQREIQRLAFYDVLTGLPNRMLLMDRAQLALAQASRHHTGGAMLFIDLDNFKTLNDTLGHDKGDLLLQQVAHRLQGCVRGSDTVARLGGDEFVVMLGELSSDAQERALEARTAAEKILLTLAMPYQLEDHHYRTTPSIGIAPFRGGELTVGDLLKQADLAMYQAKTGGRNMLRFFDPQMQAVVSARAALEADMRAALAQGEFSLHYQPQVRHNGDLLGVEALARWTHPEKGMISPADFIPVAEDTGLILTLGRWVLHTACRTLAQWQSEPRLRHLSMAVNVSSKQFRSGSFVEDVSRILAVTGAPAKRLKLELTESVLVENVEAIISTMESLRSIGVNFSLDDFGTGYSSLSYLKRMPLQQLKIDQSFVRDLLTDPNDAAIVDTIVALSATLGLDVIAEGVETFEQREMLLGAGCMSFQGYLYSRPLSAEALQELLQAQ